jgi:hypothetical protein
MTEVKLDDLCLHPVKDGTQPSNLVNGNYFSEEGKKNRDKRKEKFSFQFLVAVYLLLKYLFSDG